LIAPAGMPAHAGSRSRVHGGRIPLLCSDDWIARRRGQRRPR
jgi:hypothetical protein